MGKQLSVEQCSFCVFVDSYKKSDIGENISGKMTKLIIS